MEKLTSKEKVFFETKKRRSREFRGCAVDTGFVFTFSANGARDIHDNHTHRTRDNIRSGSKDKEERKRLAEAQ
jgi:hypothetical protein